MSRGAAGRRTNAEYARRTCTRLASPSLAIHKAPRVDPPKQTNRRQRSTTPTHHLSNARPPALSQRPPDASTNSTYCTALSPLPTSTPSSSLDTAYTSSLSAAHRSVSCGASSHRGRNVQGNLPASRCSSHLEICTARSSAPPLGQSRTQQEEKRTHSSVRQDRVSWSSVDATKGKGTHWGKESGRTGRTGAR